MRTIIAGSRSLGRTHLFRALLECPFREEISTVISGTARGIDKAGEEWAKNVGKQVERFPAQWDLFGKRAGIVRNRAMANDADALVAVWDGKSRGTKDMIDVANRLGLKVFVWQTD